MGEGSGWDLTIRPAASGNLGMFQGKMFAANVSRQNVHGKMFTANDHSKCSRQTFEPRDIRSTQPRHWMVFGQLVMPVQCCAGAPAACHPPRCGRATIQCVILASWRRWYWPPADPHRQSLGAKKQGLWVTEFEYAVRNGQARDALVEQIRVTFQIMETFSVTNIPK